MKKINTAIFITALAVCLAGCGNKAKNDTSSKADASSAADSSVAETITETITTADETEVTLPEDTVTVTREDMPACGMTVSTLTGGDENSATTEDFEARTGDVFFEDSEGHWYLPEISDQQEYLIKAETDQPIINIFEINDDYVMINLIENIPFGDTKDIASTFQLLNDVNFSHKIVFGSSDKTQGDTPVCKMTVNTTYGGTDENGNELESGTFSDDFEIKGGDIFFEDPDGHWYLPEVNDKGEFILKSDFDVPIIEIKAVGGSSASINLVDTVNYGDTRDVASNIASSDLTHKVTFTEKSE